MKRYLRLLLTIGAILLLVGCADDSIRLGVVIPIENESDNTIKQIIVSDEWQSLSGTKYRFEQNGNGKITTNSETVQTTWTNSGSHVSVSFKYKTTAKWTTNGTTTEREVELPLTYEFDLYMVDGYRRLVSSGSGFSLYPVKDLPLIKALYENGRVFSELRIQMNQLLSTDSIEVNLQEASFITDLVGSSGSGTHPAAEKGKQYLCIKGTISNLGGKPINLNRIVTECIIGGKSYPVSIYADTDGTLKSFIDPLWDGDLYLLASIPESLARGNFNAVFRMRVKNNLSFPCEFDAEADMIIALEINEKSSSISSSRTSATPKPTATPKPKATSTPRPTATPAMFPRTQIRLDNGSIYGYKVDLSSVDDEQIFKWSKKSKKAQVNKRMTTVFIELLGNTNNCVGIDVVFYQWADKGNPSSTQYRGYARLDGNKWRPGDKTTDFSVVLSKDEDYKPNRLTIAFASPEHPDAISVEPTRAKEHGALSSVYISITGMYFSSEQAASTYARSIGLN